MNDRPARKHKTFDAVENKRRIQEAIYEETKHMSKDELLAYFREEKPAQQNPNAS